MTAIIRAALAVVVLVLAQPALAADDPLPSWNDGAARERIVNFVKAVSDPTSKDYVQPDERIAVFDNDGTLWGEQPAYFQLLFAIDRVKALAPQHPEWKTTQPFKAALEGDMEALAASGQQGLLELIMASHAGMTPEEFKQTVSDWLATAKHPRFDRAYTEVVYQPMLELLSYLQKNGFTTYIVSGGGIEFLRAWSEDIYSIPPEQVVGSSIITKYELRDGEPTLIRLPEFNFINDKAGKPVAINQHIGRRPIAAFGNSDGDLQMLEWTTAGERPRLGVIGHHTDSEHEYAYDRNSSIGRLDKALDMAADKRWVVVDMKSDWNRVFPFEK